MQEKVATEMDFFMQQLSKNEKSNTKRIQVALDKTERINTSILELSEVTGASITSLTQGMKEEMSALRRDIRNTNKTSSEKSKSLFDMSIADLEISMKKADMATKARVEELSLQCADERFLVISSSVTDTREAVKALTTGMEFDHGNVLEYSKSEKGTIHQALAAVIQSLGGQKICSEKKDDPVEIIPLLEEHEALIKDNATQLKIMEDKFEAICAQQAQLEEGLGKKIAALIDKNVQKEEEVAKAVNTSLRQAHVKITELSNCAEEQRESIARLDRITKSAQVNIERIASLTDHLASDMESFKSRVMGLIDDMKRICLDFIVEKHEELVKQCIFLQ